MCAVCERVSERVWVSMYIMCECAFVSVCEREGVRERETRCVYSGGYRVWVPQH